MSIWPANCGDAGEHSNCEKAVPRSYLDGEGAQRDTDVSVDVLPLAPENRVLSHGKDMVLLPTTVAVAGNRMVDHEPVVHIYTPESQRFVPSCHGVNAH